MLFRLFQIFIGDYGLWRNSHLVTFEEHPKKIQHLYSQWICTNLFNLKDRELMAWKKYHQNGEVIFRQYRFNVTKQLIECSIEQGEDRKKVMKIINQSEGLSEKERGVLLKMIKENDLKMDVVQKVEAELGRGDLISALATCLEE